MIPISISPSTISGAGVSAESSKLIELLHAFAVLAPPERVIHVGTGSRPSETLCWSDWPLTEAIVIDAEEQDFEHIDAGLNPKTKISKHCAVLAETDGAVDYFVANNLSENGLVDPTLLRMIWPSLAQSHRSKKDASTIDHLVSEATLQSWLIVDCLPAVRILSGARNTLKDSTLVCVRALAESGFRGEPVGADIKSIDGWLEGLGFKSLAFVTGLNPKIGYAIYGRSAEKPIEPQDLPLVKALNQDLESVRKELLQALDEKLRVSADLTKERDASQMRAVELETQLKTAAEQHATATSQQAKAHTDAQAALQIKLAEALQQVEAQTQAKDQALQQVVLQTQAKDKALQQLAEAQKSVEATQKSLTDTQSALAAIQQSEAEAKKTAETTAAYLKQAQATQQEVQAKLDAVTKERDATKTRAAELEAQLKIAAEHHATVTAQHAKAHIDAQAALQAKLTEAQKQVEAQTQAKNQALEQVAVQTQTKDKALQQLAEAQKSVETLQKSLADTQTALAAIKQSEAEAKKTAETTAASLKQAQATQQEVQTKLDAITKERDATKTRAAELEVQLNTAAVQHAELLTKQEQTNLALQTKFTETQKQVEAQLQAKDKVQQDLASLQKKIDTVQNSFDVATTSLKAKETALQTELERIKHLTAENKQLSLRQQLMNEELIKAEGQISLIKDLLLREEGI